MWREDQIGNILMTWTQSLAQRMHLRSVPEVQGGVGEMFKGKSKYHPNDIAWVKAYLASQ